MKKLYLVSIFVMMLAMLFLPLAANGHDKGEESLPAATIPFIPQESDGSVIRVYHTDSGKVEEMSTEDYLFSVVAAEMPALYENEALKAQAVAAYTYAMFKSSKSEGEYDITDDSAIDQAFVSRDAARKRWGESADIYEEKIRSAIKSVLNQKITYDSKPILAAYHAISSGKTENAKDIWGGDYAYLISVDSEGDKLSPDYLSSVSFTADELKTKLEGVAALSGEADGWFGEMKKSGSGSVLSVAVSGKSVSGGDIRKALSLRSENFDIVYSDGKFSFNVRGYGHGIGMSQYGAHYMAMQGKTYKEILLHYYPGCEVG